MGVHVPMCMHTSVHLCTRYQCTLGSLTEAIGMALEGLTVASPGETKCILIFFIKKAIMHIIRNLGEAKGIQVSMVAQRQAVSSYQFVVYPSPYLKS